MKKLIMLLSVFMVVMTLSACKEKEEDVKLTWKAPEKEAVDISKAEEIKGVITVEDMADEGSKNGMAAEAKYKGKIVTVKGYLSNIGSNNISLYAEPLNADIKSINRKQGANVSIPKDEVEKYVGVLSSYVVGDEITIKAYVEYPPGATYSGLQLIEVIE